MNRRLTIKKQSTVLVDCGNIRGYLESYRGISELIMGWSLEELLQNEPWSLLGAFRVLRDNARGSYLKGRARAEWEALFHFHLWLAHSAPVKIISQLSINTCIYMCALLPMVRAFTTWTRAKSQIEVKSQVHIPFIIWKCPTKSNLKVNIYWWGT